MRQNRWSLLTVAILVAAVACNPQPVGSPPAGSVLEASGVITADEVVASSPHGGRIGAVHVATGDGVRAGQRLVTLDTELIDAQIAVAEAELGVAQAGLEQMEAGARPGQIAVAQARLAQAKAGHEAAAQGLADASALRSNPQELNMQIAVGESVVEAEKHRLASAQAYNEAAQIGKDVLEYAEAMIRDWPYPFSPPTVPAELRFVTYEWWRSWVGVNGGTASVEAAETELAHWRSVLEKPQELDAQVELARATMAEAAAAVDAAEAQLDALGAGASEEQLAVMHAQVAQAQGALRALLEQRKEMVVIAPVDGTIVSLAAHAGEIAVPGGMLLSLADLSKLRMTVYVSENHLGQIALNQRVMVTVDSFPERTFEGRILHIADRAQYTPINVSTKEERVNTVYAVEILLSNPDGLLKPGMPGDAVFVR